MNEKLTFSWGHIVAALVLIAVSYFSFVGFFYLAKGDFYFALSGMILTLLFYILFFIGPQYLKASGVKMAKKIIWERILLFGSPLIFIAGMFSISHFWTVHNKQEEIVSSFKNSINNSKQLFKDYETYAQIRINNYDQGLTKIINEKNINPQLYKNAGFTNENDEVQKANMVEALQLALLSQNYESLQKLSSQWIERANDDVSVWNVFLLGNSQEIKNAVENWKQQLTQFSEKQISNENKITDVETFTSNGAKLAIDGIDNLKETMAMKDSPIWWIWILGIVLYLLMLFPYFLQDRHSKSVYINIFKKRPSLKIISMDSTGNDINIDEEETFRL